MADNGEAGKPTVAGGPDAGGAVEHVRINPDGSIVVPESRAQIASVDVADVDLLLNFSDGHHVLIPNGALDALGDSPPRVHFSDDNGHSVFLDDLFKLVSETNLSRTGAMGLVSEHVDTPHTGDDNPASAHADRGDSGRPPQPPPEIQTGDLPPMERISGGIPMDSGDDDGYGPHVDQSAVDPVVSNVAPRPSVYRSGHKTATVADPTVSLDANITADNVINIAESSSTVWVSGRAGGGAHVGDPVTVTVNGHDYTGILQGDRSFSVGVSGADLAVDSDLTVEAKLVGKNDAGNPVTVTDSASYGLDLTAPNPTLNLDANVSADDVIDASEAAGTVAVTGSVGGEARAGDVVTVTVNGHDYTGTVQSDRTFSVNVAGSDLAADADHTVDGVVVATDDAGNQGTAADSEGYGVNTATPVPTISLDPNITADDVINIAESGGDVAVTGTVGGDAHGGDMVTLTVNGVDSVGLVRSDNTFSINVQGADLVADSDHVIDATVTSGSPGNQASVSTSEGYGVDVTAPADPTVSLASDTGSDGADRITSDGSLSLGGIETGTVVEYSVDNGTSWSQSFTPAEGANDVLVRQTDAAGNAGGAGSLSFTLDSSVPSAPALSLANDTGASGNDHVTSDPTLVLSGIESGTVVEYSLDGSSGWSTSQPVINGGNNTIYVRQTDLAGNVSGTGNLNFNYDATAPVTPAISSVTDNQLPWIGALSSGGVSNDATPTLSGNAEASTTVTIFDNGGAIGTTTADVVGHWSYTPSSLANGSSHSFTVTSSDLAGNTSPSSAAFAINIDTSTPPAPVISGVDDDVGPVTGTVSNGGYTNDNNPLITGTAEANATLKLYDFSFLAAQITTDSTGHWSYSSYLTNTSTHSYTATVTDSAGNVSGASSAYVIHIDTGIITPTLAISDNVGPVTGTVADGGYTNDTTPTLSGTAESGSQLDIYDNGSLLTSFTNTGSSAWSYTPSTGLADGSSHSFTVTSTDAAGNSASSGSIGITIDTTAPNPAITLDPNITADDIIDIAESSGTVAITGTTGGEVVAGDTVTVSVNGHDYNGTVQSGGTFSVNVAGSDLAAAGSGATGTVSAAVTLTDAAGNTATATDTETYSIDLSDPDFTTEMRTPAEFKLSGGSPVNPVPVGASDPSPAAQATREVINGSAGNDTIGHNSAFSNGVGQWTRVVHLDFTTFTSLTSGQIVISDDISAISGFDFQGAAVTGKSGNTWTLNLDNSMLSGGLDLDLVYDVAGGTAAAVDFSADITASGTAGSLAFDVTNSVDLSWRPAVSQSDFTVTSGSGQQVMILPQEGIGVEIHAGAGDDTVNAGAGHDLLYGEAGNDSLSGGTGDDILAGGSGGDTLDGGAGSDTASYAGSAAAVSVDLAAGSASGGDAAGDTMNSIENLTGSDYNDTLTGDSGANILSGGSGDDLIIGGAGADVLDGGAGTDTASYAGAAGDVTVSLATGSGSAGDALGDTLSGIENLTGGDGNDTLIGGSGANVLDGGAAGSDTASYADSGGDVVASLLTGGSAGDAAGDSYISIENLHGGSGNDTLTGDGNDNILTGGAGADALIGGAGSDTASYADAGSGVTVSFTDSLANFQSGEAAGDTFSSVENLVGSAYGDILYGDSGANQINGGDGDDNLEGMAGDDTLIGGAGDDTIYADQGHDTVSGGSGDDTITVNAAAGDSPVQIDGGGQSGTGNGDTLVIKDLVGGDYNLNSMANVCNSIETLDLKDGVNSNLILSGPDIQAMVDAGNSSSLHILADNGDTLSFTPAGTETMSAGVDGIYTISDGGVQVAEINWDVA